MKSQRLEEIIFVFQRLDFTPKSLVGEKRLYELCNNLARQKHKNGFKPELFQDIWKQTAFDSKGNVVIEDFCETVEKAENTLKTNLEKIRRDGLIQQLQKRIDQQKQQLQQIVTFKTGSDSEITALRKNICQDEVQLQEIKYDYQFFSQELQLLTKTFQKREPLLVQKIQPTQVWINEPVPTKQSQQIPTLVFLTLLGLILDLNIQASCKSQAGVLSYVHLLGLLFIRFYSNYASSIHIGLTIYSLFATIFWLCTDQNGIRHTLSWILLDKIFALLTVLMRIACLWLFLPFRNKQAQATHFKFWGSIVSLRYSET